MEVLHIKGKEIGVYAISLSFLFVGFSLLRTSEFFVFRKMEMAEIKNHLLCRWSTKRLQALENQISYVIISVGPKPH